MALSSIILSLAMMEVITRLIDPLGMARYRREIIILDSHEIPDATRGYTYPAGVMDMGTWRATIDANGNRVVPHANLTSSCRLVIIGDSVTFGFGVNDDEVWPELLAQHISANIVNTAKSGYNAKNFGPLIQVSPADAYIYLAIANDAEPPQKYKPYHRPVPLHSALEEVIFWVLIVPKDKYIPPPVSNYVAGMDEVLAMPNLLIASIDENPFNPELTQARPDTIIIPRWTHNNSIIDPHPNAIGHQEILQSLLPHILKWLPTMCNGT